MLLGDCIPELLTDPQQPDGNFRFGADASGQQNPTPDLLVSDPSMQAPQQTTLMAYAQALADSQKRAVGLQDQSNWLLAQLNKPDAKSKGCVDALKEWRAQP